MSQASPIAERLSRYAYSPSQRTTRKRPRPLPVKEEASSPSDSEGSGDDYDTSDSDTDAPRVRATKKRADGTVVKYGWPKDVKVAHPSKYEDYPELDDLLRPELDLVFIGINPGKKSSLEGHFFAHSTNKFWRSLYGCGMTPRLFTPYEDLKLPSQCNIGLTNLVDRCTAMVSELTALEQRIAVYPLVKKLSENGPKVACFVGKGIWQQFESIVKRSSTPAAAAEAQEDEAGPSQGTNRTPRVIRYRLQNGQAAPDDRDSPEAQVKAEPESPSSLASMGEVESSLLDDGLDEPITPMRNPRSPTITPTPRPRKGKAKTPAKPKPPKKPFLWDAPQMYRLPSTAEGGYTYLWVVPNTSGLERSTLGEQIEHFSALKRLVDRLKRDEGPLARDGNGNDPPRVEDVFWNIDLDAVKQTCEAEEDKRRATKKRK